MTIIFDEDKLDKLDVIKAMILLGKIKSIIHKSENGEMTLKFAPCGCDNPSCDMKYGKIDEVRGTRHVSKN